MRKAGGSYPPWSYAFGVLLVPPVEWQLTRWYFALLCVIALIVSAHCSYRWARPEGWAPAAAAGLLVFSNFSTAICISYGQYGVLVLGLQLGAIAALGGRREVLAGGLLGLAMVKPQLTGLLVLGLLLNGFFTTVAVVATLVGMGTLVCALVVGQWPWELVRSSLQESTLYLSALS